MASSATVGSAVIKLSFDGKNAKAELNNMEKEVERKGSSIGSKIKTVAGNIGKALASAFAVGTTAVIAFTKSSVDAFNTQEKALAKLEQSAKNQSWAENAVDDLKKYNAELQKTGIIADEVNASGQAQLGTFGLSAEAVKKLTPAMDDLIAATAGYGANTESATAMANLMGKVMTGSVSALTRYGVTLDENQKKLLETGDEMTRASVLAEVLKQNYGGFNEALAKTPQGQVKQLANNFGDLKEQFGAFIAGKGDLSGFFDTLKLTFDNIINLITSMAPQVIEGISTLLKAIMTKLPDMIATLLPTIVDALSGLAVAFAEALPAFTQALIDGLTALINSLTQNLPTILKAVTDALIQVANVLTKPENLKMMLKASLEFFMQLVKCLPDVIVALVNALPTIIDNIIAFLTDPETIQMLIEAAIQLFMALVMAVPQILGGILQAFGTLVGNIWDGITQMFGEFAGNFGEFIGDIFKNAINGVLTFIENFVNLPIDALNGFIWLINQAFGWIGVDIGYIDRIQLPRLAQGGFVDGATTAMIGEDGAEAVLPLENNTDNWAGLLAQTLVAEMEIENVGRAGVTIEKQEFIINNEMDAQDIGRVMMQSIRRSA